MIKNLFQIYAGVALLVMIGSLAYFKKKDEIEKWFVVGITIFMVTVALKAIAIIAEGFKGLFM